MLMYCNLAFTDYFHMPGTVLYFGNTKQKNVTIQVCTKVQGEKLAG